MTEEYEQMTMFDRDTWSGKTSPEPSAPQKAKTSAPSLKKPRGSRTKMPLFLDLRTENGRQPDVSWETDGASLGGYSMHSIGESPSVAVESRLSQILEDTPHPKYYLSAKACQGILRRAERRGKELPEMLKTALERQSASKATALTARTPPDATKGWRDDDVSFTLNTIDRPAVYDCRGNGDGKTAPTLTGDPQNRVTDYTAVCIGNGQADQLKTSNKVGALNCMHDQQAVMVCAVDCRNGTENPETNGTLQAKSNGGMSLNLQNTVRVASLVRRLTPLECERLQGYPDGWTDLGEWTDSKGRVHQTSDSARYKALGNSIALPPWRFVLGRLNAYLTEHTMASLFDGIGGFPLIWQELNGRGKCLWASEIEEFPIAVTKRRVV